jgi:putative oxidoreductase
VVFSHGSSRVFLTEGNDQLNQGEGAMAIINQRWSERMLSVLRVVTALLFLQHGLAKLFAFPHVAAFDNLQYFSLLGLAGLIEIVGSVMLLLGLYTRLARS